jgi:predicted O-methyltransferase YrrM
MFENLQARVGQSLFRLLPSETVKSLIQAVSNREPGLILEAFGPLLNREPNLERMTFDLPIDSPFRFENLSGLFSSTSLDHAVISMTVRQAAYIFGLIRTTQPRKIIEIGRFKGGSTFLIAAAMSPDCELWSIDLGEKEARRKRPSSESSYDEQLAEVCHRFGFKVHLLVGDARTIRFDLGEVDLVFIDGDHSYDGAKSDFERFGRGVRVGGNVLFDDTFDEKLFKTHSDTVGRLVKEIIAAGDFTLVKGVNRLAHLKRVR